MKLCRLLPKIGGSIFEVLEIPPLWPTYAIRGERRPTFAKAK
jgi:hypothetical protein